jgi:membrane peptidoglycan carboxypeptidase
LLDNVDDVQYRRRDSPRRGTRRHRRRLALAESRNAVAIWITEQIGVAGVLQTARSLGIHTPLRPYATTALGASEVNLLELANAYRTIASGILTQPYVIRKIVRDSGEAKPHRDLRLPLEVGLNIGANSHTARITLSPVSIRTFPPLR